MDAEAPRLPLAPRFGDDLVGAMQFSKYYHIDITHHNSPDPLSAPYSVVVFFASIAVLASTSLPLTWLLS